MPLAMVVGVVLCRPLAYIEAASQNMLTPLLIASMLFITFCRIDIREMRLRWIHLWMLAVQLRKLWKQKRVENLRAIGLKNALKNSLAIIISLVLEVFVKDDDYKSY